MPDLRQTKEFTQFLKLRGWIVEKVNQDFIFIRKIPLTPFSIIKIQRINKIDSKKVNQAAKKHHAFQIFIEPSKAIKGLKRNGFKQNRSFFLPTKTLRLDLTKTQEKIMAQMKKDARYSIKKAERQNFLLMESKDLKQFHQAWRKAVGLKRHVPSLNSLKALKKTFGQKAVFLAIIFEDRILAGTIILFPKKTAYYYYAFTSKKGRKKLVQYLLVWEAIKLTKKQGCQAFDFEGIYDSRFPNKAWRGFSHFKKSFGGKEIEYPGCWRKYQLPF